MCEKPLRLLLQLIARASINHPCLARSQRGRPPTKPVRVPGTQPTASPQNLPPVVSTNAHLRVLHHGNVFVRIGCPRSCWDEWGGFLAATNVQSGRCGRGLGGGGRVKGGFLRHLARRYFHRTAVRYTDWHAPSKVGNYGEKLVPCLNVKGPRLLSGYTARLPPRRTGFDPRPGHPRIFASGIRAGRCLWSAGFIGDLPFPPLLHSGAASLSLHFTLIGSQGLVISCWLDCLLAVNFQELIGERLSDVLLESVLHLAGACGWSSQVKRPFHFYILRYSAVRCKESWEKTATRGESRGGIVVRLLASHLGEPGSIPGGVAHGFFGNHARRCRWSAGILGYLLLPPSFHSNTPPPYSPHFTLIGSQDLDIKRRLNIPAFLHLVPPLVWIILSSFDISFGGSLPPHTATKLGLREATPPRNAPPSTPRRRTPDLPHAHGATQRNAARDADQYAGSAASRPARHTSAGAASAAGTTFSLVVPRARRVAGSAAAPAARPPVTSRPCALLRGFPRRAGWKGTGSKQHVAGPITRCYTHAMEIKAKFTAQMKRDDGAVIRRRDYPLLVKLKAYISGAGSTCMSDGNTAFLRAARAGNLDKVLEHLKANIDINTSNSCIEGGSNMIQTTEVAGRQEPRTTAVLPTIKVEYITLEGAKTLHVRRRARNTVGSFTYIDWLDYFLARADYLQMNHVGAVPMLPNSEWPGTVDPTRSEARPTATRSQSETQYNIVKFISVRAMKVLYIYRLFTSHFIVNSHCVPCGCDVPLPLGKQELVSAGGLPPPNHPRSSTEDCSHAQYQAGIKQASSTPTFATAPPGSSTRGQSLYRAFAALIEH
ncbi:hypothetical protein PR048_030436 [Dryococelus australis]|uniref:Uncharacterized protein n=1 Tax=Dryococelus australis TaxID=614101 RepID=A0ABQ9G8Z3_9NEOP|nr:hypothetical protein PR048_030436 [Dryococelus australis]